MPQSLHRTWAALALAALAVLIVAFVTGRDFVRDVRPECPGSLVSLPAPSGPLGSLEPVYFDFADPTTLSARPSFQRLFDEKPGRGFMQSTRYEDVRVVWRELGKDGTVCTCGSLPVTLSGEVPSDLHLYRVSGTETYVLRGRNTGSNDLRALDLDDPTLRAFFRVDHRAVRRLHTDRIFTQHHLPALVMLLAMGALGVALFRSRRAMSYALRLHAWTPAVLTPEGVIESESGTPLATLEQAGMRRAASGPILVAPAAIPSGSLYRDMPVIARRNIAEGTHTRWAGATMLRLRDARALAIISTACTALAFGARLIAS